MGPTCPNATGPPQRIDLQLHYPRKPGDRRGYDMDSYLAQMDSSKLRQEIPLIEYLRR